MEVTEKKKRGGRRFKKTYDREAAINHAIECYKTGYNASRIIGILNREYGVPFNDWIELKQEVKNRIKESCDVYAEIAFEMQMARLDDLIERAIEAGDDAQALKVIAEQNKLLNLYNQKIQVTIDEYKISL